MNKIDIAGLKIDSVTKDELLKQVKERILSNQKTTIFTPYSEFLYRAFQNPELLKTLNTADFSVADGIGIFWAKKYLSIPLTAKNYWLKIWQAGWQIFYSIASILFYPKFIKSALPEKIVGADLIWDLAKFAEENNHSVFLLGGFNNTAELAAKQLKTQNSKLNIAGASNKNPNDESTVRDINTSKTDLLLVAYGPITQEEWIVKNMPQLNIKLAMGVGGSFDYIAGIKQSPPKFIRYSGLEWLWRLITQPYRVKRIFQATFGLIWGLWHYKVFSNLPLRPNVAVVIINNHNEILVGERNPFQTDIDIISTQKTLNTLGYWQIPQGGIDENEDLAEAAKREAFEETGLSNLELFKISETTHTYIWNNTLRRFWKNRYKKNIGQKQNIVYLKFSGQNNEVKIDNKEFISYKWVSINELEKTIHPERMGLTKIILEDLKSLV